MDHSHDGWNDVQVLVRCQRLNICKHRIEACYSESFRNERVFKETTTMNSRHRRRCLISLLLVVLCSGAVLGCASDSEDSQPDAGFDVGADAAGAGGDSGNGGKGGRNDRDASSGGGGVDAGAGEGGGEAGGQGGSHSGGAPGGGGVAGSGGNGGSGGNSLESKLKTITGTLTWTVTFDADAKAAGAVDCVYERTYTGQEDRSVPWICPTCEPVFRTSVVMTKGLNDCFKAYVSKGDPRPEEWLGVAAGKLYRTALTAIGANALGDTVTTATGFTSTHEVKGEAAEALGKGKLSFTIVGNFTIGEGVGDPMRGWSAPDKYTCGWTKANPPVYTGDYKLAKGAIIPDGNMRDACDESFRLHDAKGSYLVLVVSARDCPACKQMASGDSAMVASMASAGITVKTITVLQQSLKDPFTSPNVTALKAWAIMNDIKTPVLAERGLGMFMLLQQFSNEISLPSWIVVAPDLKVVEIGTGAAWADISAVIRSHHGG